MRSTHVRARLCVLAIALATTACFRGGRDEVAPLDERRGLDDPVVIRVENHNFYDATVYAVWGGNRERLGVVEGYNAGTFSTRWNAGDFRFGIDLLASTSCYTGRVIVNPGDELHLTIRPDLHLQSDPLCL